MSEIVPKGFLVSYHAIIGIIGIIFSDGKLHKSQMKRERRILQLMRYQQKLITQSAAMLGDPQAPTEEDSIILSNTQEVKSKRKAGMWGVLEG